MKRIFSLGLIATVLAAFTFTSCSKDDDDDASIVGKWKLETINEKGGGIDVTISAADMGSTDIMEFKNDGTYTTTSEYDGEKEVSTGKYTTKGNVLTLTNEDGTENIKFSISGNKLTLQGEYYYDEENDEEYETQPTGKNYPKVTASFIYTRI